MTVSNMKTTLKSNIKDVWEIVTSLDNYAWRSDISRIEIVNEKQFIEYTKDDYPTTFTIIVKEPYRYEFDMDNSNMSGHWTGIFNQLADGVEIDFTEDVTAKKVFMKPFVKGYLKKQQETYVNDLKKALCK
ncbi:MULTISPECIES: SRPBCC family protein [Erysipelotrichaceae]|uniref:SRPBCC family protein n=1 Tax=Erysipelotrichaceae TaxID=128827 RepID=UPI000E4A8746|nr:SRPBCC family protein [Absiella sp. AM27-20]RHU07481.1 polyketide cyclase [Absiella sp. AM27-20]